MSSLTTRRRRADGLFRAVCLAAAAAGALILLLVLGKLLVDGWRGLSWSFVTRPSDARVSQSGVWTPVVGTLWIAGLTTLLAVPVGIASAIYLEEFTVRKTWLTSFISLNIANLAGVPSIVYGLLGLAVFVRALALGTSVLAGALTMSLLVLPTVIIVTQEALKAVPQTFREAALGLGATRWQAIRWQVVPAALPGIATGIILALSRAAGETAPLIVVGAVASINRVPNSLDDSYTVLPLQIFEWAAEPAADKRAAAAAAIVVLMAALLLLNSIAIVLRNKSRRGR